MIKVVVFLETDREDHLLAEMDISYMQRTGVGDISQYHAVVAVDDAESDCFMQVNAYHDRYGQNVLGLIKNVLNELTDEQLELKGPISGQAGTPDMARRLGRAGQEVQRWTGRLRDYRSALRGEQPF